MKKTIVAACIVAVLASAGGGSAAPNGSQTGLCIAATPPVDPKTLVRTPIFDPSTIAEPILRLNFATEIAARSSFAIEYVGDDAGTPPIVDEIDPATVRVIERSDNAERAIDLRDIEFDLRKGKARILITAPTGHLDGPKKGTAAEVAAIGNKPWYIFDPIWGDSVAIGQPLGAGAGLTPQAASTLRDSLILLVRSDGALCNGTHIGNGKIVTAAHCAQKSVRALFGAVWTDSTGIHGEVECPAARDLQITARPPAAGEAPMDIAVLTVSENFKVLAPARKFADAKVSVGTKAQPPTAFRMIAVWTMLDRVAVAVGPSGKHYVPDFLAKQDFGPPSNTPSDPSFAWCQVVQASLLDKCVAKQVQGINASGWVHRCPVVGGLSGAPLFDAADPGLAIVAVVSGDVPQLKQGGPRNNCATPASYLPEQ